MSLPIYTQGRLDGLCGIYAFVNGYIHRLMQMQAVVDGSLGGDLSQDLFKMALQSIPKRRFPDIIWEGMDADALFECCCRTCAKINREFGYEHEIIRPFRPRQFRKIVNFFDALVPYHCDPPASFIILGLEGVADHWVAFRSFRSDKIKFLNNGPQNSIAEGEFSLRQGSQHFIRQEETIIVRLTSLGPDD
jgi:hypothetical protein